MTRELIKYFEMNENEDKIDQHLQDAAEVVLTGKFIAVNTYIKKEVRSQINKIALQFMKLKT